MRVRKAKLLPRNLALANQEIMRAVNNKALRFLFISLDDPDLHGTINNAAANSVPGPQFFIVEGRPRVNLPPIKQPDGTIVTFGSVSVASIIYFFNPRLCWMKTETGGYCGQRHRTPYEFCAAHTNNVTPDEIHISHLFHVRASVIPARLYMESRVVS